MMRCYGDARGGGEVIDDTTNHSSFSQDRDQAKLDQDPIIINQTPTTDSIPGQIIVIKEANKILFYTYIDIHTSYMYNV